MKFLNCIHKNNSCNYLLNITDFRSLFPLSAIEHCQSLTLLSTSTNILSPVILPPPPPLFPPFSLGTMNQFYHSALPLPLPHYIEVQSAFLHLTYTPSGSSYPSGIWRRAYPVSLFFPPFGMKIHSRSPNDNSGHVYRISICLFNYIESPARIYCWR